MPTFQHDGISFHYHDSGGDRLPFFFQHGLTGNLSQSIGVMSPTPPGVRLLAFDARGHGETPLDDESKLGFDTFADDLIAFMDERGVDKAVVGGISMGAGITLNTVLRHPERVLAAVMVRPAWTDAADPDNLMLMKRAAMLIQAHGAARGLQWFKEMPDYEALKASKPYAVEVAEREFDNPEPNPNLPLIIRMVGDAPSRDRQAWAGIGVPVLVVGSGDDAPHPYAMAEDLAMGIPGAKLVKVTAKPVDAARYAAETRGAIMAFLQDVDRAE